MRTAPRFVSLVFALSCAVSCAGSKPAAGTPADEPASVVEARARFPRFFELDVEVFSGTCSPNPGVCHNSSNYPDLRTPGSVLALAGAPCNLELPDPLQGWDRCERPASTFSVAAGSTTRIAWRQRVGPGSWRLGLAEPGPAMQNVPFEIGLADGTPLFVSADYDYDGDAEDPAIHVRVTTTGGTDAAIAVDGGDDEFRDFVDSIVSSSIGGNPNRNDVWGADALEPAALIVRGDLEGSYLWGRITETVPGTRMPLANAPIPEPAYVAIACWIEGLRSSPAAEDRIDYDRCEFAKAPVEYEVH